MPKTAKGFIRREITGDGRENGAKFVEREMGIRNQTKTKKKRSKKSQNELIGLIEKL